MPVAFSTMSSDAGNLDAEACSISIEYEIVGFSYDIGDVVNNPQELES